MWKFSQPFAVVSNMLNKDIAHIWEKRKRTTFKMLHLTNENKFKKQITAVNKKKAMLENTVQECRQVCCECRKCFQNRQYENFVIKI